MSHKYQVINVYVGEVCERVSSLLHACLTLHHLPHNRLMRCAARGCIVLKPDHIQNYYKMM